MTEQEFIDYYNNNTGGLSFLKKCLNYNAVVQSAVLHFGTVVGNFNRGETISCDKALAEIDSFILRNTWKPICDFDGSMFSIMTDGTPDGTEVVKYKGEIPEWATHFKPLLDLPKQD